MNDLTNVIVAAAALVASIVTTFLIPLLIKKIGAEKFEELSKWVRTAVNAAEMIFAGTGLGQKKKQYVLEFLANHGYTVDTDEIDALIEAAVLELNNGK